MSYPTLTDLATATVGGLGAALGPSTGDDEQTGWRMGPCVGDDLGANISLGPSVGDDAQTLDLGPSVGDDTQPNVT